MLVLGIESSCDDTAAAVVEDGRLVLSSVVASQDAIHSRYGGIVPELASRRHIEAVIPVVEEALKGAGLKFEDVDGVAVTRGPGLVGSILVGLSFAKAASFVAGKPLTAVNHIEAHALTGFLADGPGGEAARLPLPEPPAFPFVSMVVSGGHTTILLVKSHTELTVIGRTLDDAAGEAFDKVAKLLGLGYPGGAVIDSLARGGDKTAFRFKRPYMAKGSLDFSFSGIKTAVLNAVRSEGVPEGQRLSDLAASFQEAVVDVLVEKALWAVEACSSADLVVSGGVACNSRLRERMKEAAARRNIKLFIPKPKFCTDNGAMIAAAGHHRLLKGERAGLDLNAAPSMEEF